MDHYQEALQTLRVAGSSVPEDRLSSEALVQAAGSPFRASKEQVWRARIIDSGGTGSVSYRPRNAAAPGNLPD